MKKVIAILLYTILSIYVQSQELDIHDYSERAAVHLLKELKFTKSHTNRVFRFLHPENYDKVVTKNDDFLLHDWHKQSLSEFKQMLKETPSFNLDETYKVDIIVDYGKYDFEKKRFSIKGKENKTIDVNNAKFSFKKSLIVFNNINMRHREIKEKFYLHLNKEDARLFDKIKPRKLLLTYIFKITKIELNSAPVFYNPKYGADILLNASVMYIDIKNPSNNHLYKRIELQSGLDTAKRQLQKNKVIKEIIGEWKGEYLCGNSITGLTLKISSKQNKLTGIYSFYPTSKNPNVGTGKYTINGIIDKNGRFKFYPKKWIKKPKGYTMVGLTGKINTAENTLKGLINYRGCSKFELNKIKAK